MRARRPLVLVGALLVVAVLLVAVGLAATRAGRTTATPPSDVTGAARLDLYDASHSGYTTEDLVPGARLTDSDHDRLVASYARTGADLAWVGLGANDYLANGRRPDGVAADLTRIVEDLRALPSHPSVVLGVPQDLSTVGREQPGRTWAEYREAVEGVAAALGTGLVRTADAVPPAGSDSALLAADGLHLSDRGQAAVADLVAGTLVDAVRTEPAWATTWAAAVAGPDAQVLLLGDSLTEGQGASERSRRWLDLLGVDLRESLGLAAGHRDYVPAWYAVSGESGWGVPSSDATGARPRQWAPSLGLRAMELRPGGITYAVTGTSAEVWLTVGDDAGAPRPTATVDDGDPVVLDVPAGEDGAVVVPLGDEGEHRLRLTVPPGGYAVLSGLVVTTSG